MRTICILKADDGSWVIVEANNGITSAVTSSLNDSEMIKRIMTITGMIAVPSQNTKFIGEPL